MSHEIRTPMNGIIGMTELAARIPTHRTARVPARPSSSRRDALLTMINDILDFSKIEAGKLDAGRRALQPARSPWRLIEIAGVVRTSKSLELACHDPPEVPAGR